MPNKEEPNIVKNFQSFGAKSIELTKKVEEKKEAFIKKYAPIVNTAKKGGKIFYFTLAAFLLSFALSFGISLGIKICFF